MHVCLTFIPRNERVEEQAFGRAGRNGEPGTYQIICNFFEEITNYTRILFTSKLLKQIQKIFLIQNDLSSELGKLLFPPYIINMENTNSNNNNSEEIKKSIQKQNDLIKNVLKELPMNYEKLIKKRNSNENEELQKVNQEIDKIKLKDKLFNHYLIFIKEKELKSNQLIFKDVEEQWGLWLNKITNQEVKKGTDSIKEFEKWKEKYKDGLHFENYGFLCEKIQDNFIDNNYIHNYSESITEELVTSVSNWFRKKDSPEIKKILYVQKKLENSKEKTNNNSSFIIFYYIGITHILLKDNEKGLVSLQKSKELINEEYSYLYNCYLNGEAYEKFNEQLLNMVTILYSVEGYLIDRIIYFIKKNKSFNLKKTTLDIFFQESDKYKDSFEELKSKGLNIIFVPESSGFGILSFVTKFFSKLFKNFKEQFSLNGLINPKKLLEIIKEKTKYKSDYTIEERETLNFFQKIKVRFYDALFEPNFEQKETLKFEGNDKTKKNPLFHQMIADYQRKYTNFLEKNLKEIDFDELRNAELNLNKFINELSDKTKKEMIHLLENDEKYQNIKKNLGICGISKDILLNIFIDANKFKFPEIKEPINTNNVDELSKNYGNTVYHKVMEFYLQNENDIHKGIYYKFINNLNIILEREKNIIKEKQKKIDEEKENIEKSRGLLDERQKKEEERKRKEAEEEERKRKEAEEEEERKRKEAEKEERKRKEAEEEERKRKEAEEAERKIKEAAEEAERKIKEAVEEAEKKRKEATEEESVKPKETEADSTLDEDIKLFNEKIEANNKEIEEQNRRILNFENSKLRAKEAEIPSKLNELKEDKSNPLINEALGKVFVIDNSNMKQIDGTMGEINQKVLEQYISVAAKNISNSYENKADNDIELIKNMMDQDGNAFSKRKSKLTYEYNNFDFMIIGNSIVNENKKNLNCKYIFLNYDNLEGEENIFLGNYKKDNIFITFIYIKDKNILLYLECSGKSDNVVKNDNIDNKFKEKLNINNYILKKNIQFENSSEDKKDEIICLNVLEYFLKLEEGEKRDNFINSFESYNFRELINENEKNIKENNPKYYLIECLNILKNNEKREIKEINIQEIYFFVYPKKLENINEIIIQGNFDEDYIKKFKNIEDKRRALKNLTEIRNYLKEKLNETEKKNWDDYLDTLKNHINELEDNDD